MADVDKIIESVFYNIHGGFGSIVDTYRKVKTRPGGEKITRAQVADFIKRQEIRNEDGSRWRTPSWPWALAWSTKWM